MARLPDPAEITRVAPQPARGVVSINTGIASSADVGAARAMQGLAQEMEQTARVEIAKLDELKVTDAETQLMRAEMELEAEYQQVKNQDVMTPDFHKNFQEKYRLAKDAATRGLVTPAQRARFEQLSKRRAVGFDAKRTAYAMGEAERAQDAIFQSRVDVLSQKGALTYKDPSAFQAAALELEDAYVKEMTRRGMTDPDVLTAGVQKVRGQFYSTAIERALENNDNTAASGMYVLASAANMLTPEQRQSLGNQLEAATSMELGTKIAKRASEMEQEGVAPTTIALYVAEAAGGNDQAYAKAKAVQAEIKNARKAELEEAEGGLLEMFAKANNSPQAMSKIMDSQEYKKLPEASRGKLAAYMLTQSEQALDRADRQADRADRQAERRLREKYSSPQVMANFSRLITDPALGTMSRSQIWALAPDLGYANVELLLSEREKLQGDYKPITLDKDLVAAGVPEDLKKNATEDKRDAFNGYIKQAALMWQEQNPGKQMTRQQQQVIIDSARVEYKTKGEIWGYNKAPAYAAPTGGKRLPEAEFKRNLIQQFAVKGVVLTEKETEEAYQNYLLENE